MTPPLEQVLADLRGDAAIARRLGHHQQAEQLEALADRVAASAEPWLRRLTEEDARLKSGRSLRWLRAQGPAWMALDCAWRIDGQWFFRDCIVPQRQHRSAAAEDARRTARESAA